MTAHDVSQQVDPTSSSKPVGLLSQPGKVDKSKSDQDDQKKNLGDQEPDYPSRTHEPDAPNKLFEEQLPPENQLT